MAKRTIKLLGETIQNEDDKAAEAITPGMLVTYNGSGNWIKHNVAIGAGVPFRVALEREEMGKDIDVAYAINDTVKVGVFPTGARVNLLVATAAPATTAQWPYRSRNVALMTRLSTPTLATARGPASRGSSRARRRFRHSGDYRF